MRAKKSTERIELSFTVPKTVVLIHYTTRTEPHRLMSPRVIEIVAAASSSQESNLDSDPRKVMCFPLHYRSKKKKGLSIVAVVE